MRRGGPPQRLTAVPMELDAHRRAAVSVVGQLAPVPGGTRVYRCSECGVTEVGPRPGVCRSCPLRESALDVEERRAERLLIPPRFRWARLDLQPFAPEGISRWCAHPEAVRRVRAFRGHLLVLRGESRIGKTALACARLFFEASGGSHGVFVRCQDLSGDAPEARAEHLYRRAIEERTVVIDDLGKELFGAAKDSPMASFRGPRVIRLIRDLHDISGSGTRRKLVIVTLADEKAIAGSHGEDIFGRLFERQPGVEMLNLDSLGRLATRE